MSSSYQKGTVVEQSLCIVVPVHNAQFSLRERIVNLLDVLPDLTNRFEVLVVDDYSTDQTEEVAHEMATQFPQIRVIRNLNEQGSHGAGQTGLAEARAEIVFVQDADSPLSPADLRRLWQLRTDDQLVMARTEPPAVNPQLMDRLSQWGTALKETAAEYRGQGGIQMIRRQAVSELPDNEEAADELAIMRSAADGHISPATPASFTAHLKKLATTP